MTNNELRRRREEIDLTQQQMAVFLGVSISGYCAWESGRQRIPELTALGIKQKLKSLSTEKAA